MCIGNAIINFSIINHNFNFFKFYFKNDSKAQSILLKYIFTNIINSLVFNKLIKIRTNNKLGNPRKPQTGDWG